jgi:hypothetical protein
MSKVFWEGFKEGYMKFFWIGIAFAIGIALGSYSHPYEQCKRMHDTPEDIAECVWIKENP